MLLIILFVCIEYAIAEDTSTPEKSTTDSVESTTTTDSEAESKTTPLEKQERITLSSLEEKAQEEIVVYGQKEVDRRRKILDQNLQNDGYRDGKRRGNKVIYRPETIWKPSVIVYDSGWVELKKTPPRFEPWVKGHPDNKWRYLSCIPPFTPMCLRAGGWLITKRRAQHSKTQVIDQHISEIQSWQEAVVGAGIRERLEINLPDQLELIWSDSSERPYSERREEIIYLWISRTCTPEGNEAAEIIGDFISYEIQESSHPLTAQEINDAHSQSACEREFPVPK